MSALIWFAIFAGVLLALAYHRASLRTATYSVGALLVLYSLSGPGWGWGLLCWAVFAAVALPLNREAWRKTYLTRPARDFFRRVLPPLSDTERTALEAGTVWWEGELFSGRPDWHRLAAIPEPELSAEEQAFLDGPVEQLIDLCDEWRITHEDADLPDEAWRFLKENRFFGMIIPKEYGGLGFGAYAHSCVLAKLGSGPAAITVGSTVAVPNSLGPAELLLHYGTNEQKNHYLPRLADGREIPCFALTSPHAGSDAGAIPDKGVVCRGQWNGKEILGMRLTWDKRYITLAPVATVLGLAFKLYDPDGLLGDREDIGVTCALIPTDTPGVEIGRRHFPLNAPFQNGPTRGEEVFVPLDFIIGGPEMAGEGWRMLMECLAVGRSISLPSMSSGSATAAAFATGAYARIRRQFNVHIGAFEGVQEALARIGGLAYAADSVRRFTANAVDLGETPSVPSAIAKYHCTDMARQVSIDAMDVHAGKGVCLGPSNYIGRGYQGAPIAITVEGANILTRSMMIFGQGAIRCHPYVLKEMEAARDEDDGRGLDAFDDAFFGHVGHDIAAAARSLVLGVTQGRGSAAPGERDTRRHLQRMNRYAANLALLGDLALAVLGGELKFRESISARLGDVLAYLYIASATIKRFEDDGGHPEDLPLVDWVCEDCFHRIETQLDGVLRNLPARPVAWLARALIFPVGRRAHRPDDKAGARVAGILQTPGAARRRLTQTCYVPDSADDGGLGLLDATMRMVLDCRDLEKRLMDAVKKGRVASDHPRERIEEALEAGVLDEAEAERLRALYERLMAVIRVDDFDATELRAGRSTSARKDAAAQGSAKKTARKPRRKRKKAEEA
ncbi:acyl-CoA dehydrogenase [Salinisphaera sp. PC39]|uniref:acyl-CoA dehydrogenase n=1 Tax=Salinisphaera sp. PC39 TaxID=1304156 RepID=UPI0033421EA6